ncbi:rRNA adenine N-6-methyltransferase family protein [Clostridium sp.]|uniref:rRNA adenine N-6-methyltransferase family protein n=1 Tax=Clostridium sp. TaxID=1506 RepID=UPI002FC6B7AC
MKPYDKDFLLEKIKEYDKKISSNTIGDHKISKSYDEDGITEGYMYEKNEEFNIKMPDLEGNDKYWMRISPKEIESTYGIIKNAHGKVGVVGLGLGYTVQEMAKRDEVKEIIVYEIEEDIIDLYRKNFKDNKKIKIIKGDAYKAKPETFDYFFVDIYEYKLTESVVSDYVLFNKLHNIEDYTFWGVEHFLLSCKYEEIVWVYVPEIWMELSKKAFAALQESGYLKYYNKLDESLVSEILQKFKVVLE